MFNRAEKEAKQLEKTKPFKDIFDEMGGMPQFISVYDGLLNLITGCVVSYDENGLALTYGKEVIGLGAGGGGLRYSNINLTASIKFLELMRAQANQFR